MSGGDALAMGLLAQLELLWSVELDEDDDLAVDFDPDGDA